MNTHNTTRELLAALCAAGLVLTACSAEASSSSGAQAESTPAPPNSATTLTSSARRQIDALLDAYEQVRAALVADRGDVAAAARQIASSARGARDDAPASLREHLEGIATEADQLAAGSPSDLPQLRREFGDVSRNLIALLSAEASIAQGLHVFECPMADGYDRWVQPNADISNPYMGSRMPACGTETRL